MYFLYRLIMNHHQFQKEIFRVRTIEYMYDLWELEAQKRLLLGPQNVIIKRAYFQNFYNFLNEYYSKWMTHKHNTLALPSGSRELSNFYTDYINAFHKWTIGHLFSNQPTWTQFPPDDIFKGNVPVPEYIEKQYSETQLNAIKQANRNFFAENNLARITTTEKPKWQEILEQQSIPVQKGEWQKPFSGPEPIQAFLQENLDKKIRNKEERTRHIYNTMHEQPMAPIPVIHALPPKISNDIPLGDVNWGIHSPLVKYEKYINGQEKSLGKKRTFSQNYEESKEYFFEQDNMGELFSLILDKVKGRLEQATMLSRLAIKDYYPDFAQIADNIFTTIYEYIEENSKEVLDSETIVVLCNRFVLLYTITFILLDIGLNDKISKEEHNVYELIQNIDTKGKRIYLKGDELPPSIQRELMELQDNITPMSNDIKTKRKIESKNSLKYSNELLFTQNKIGNQEWEDVFEEKHLVKDPEYMEENSNEKEYSKKKDTSSILSSQNNTKPKDKLPGTRTMELINDLNRLRQEQDNAQFKRQSKSK